MNGHWRENVFLVERLSPDGLDLTSVARFHFRNNLPPSP